MLKAKLFSVVLSALLMLAVGAAARAQGPQAREGYARPQGQYIPNAAMQPGAYTMQPAYPVQPHPAGNEQFSGDQRLPSTNLQLLQQWFQSYDQIRRNAQMNPTEKQRADALMSRGLAMFVPGQEKEETGKLLSSLVNRYQVAADQMKRLPLYPETERLHRGYYQYFSDAQHLFSDYLSVQGNIFQKDQSGNPIAAGLMQRKQNLEALDNNNKAIDSQLRAVLGIPAYHY